MPHTYNKHRFLHIIYSPPLKIIDVYLTMLIWLVSIILLEKLQNVHK